MVTVIALHGFTRAPRHLETFAQVCEQQGWRCLRPALAPQWIPLLMNSKRHLDSVARQLIPKCSDDQVIIVGHSAGAAAGSWIARRLLKANINLIGIIMVDGNDSPNKLIEQSWSDLSNLPVIGVLAPPSPCNRQGRLEQFLKVHDAEEIHIIDHSGHGDIEMTDSKMYARVCGDESTQQTKTLVLHTTIQAIESLLTRN